MSTKHYANIAVPHTRLHELTYEFEPDRLPELGPGACVQVRLRGKKVKGIVLATLAQSPVPRTLPVERLIEPRLIPEPLLHLLRWVNAYYFGRMGETLGLAVPRGLCGYGLRQTRQPPRADTGPPVSASDLSPASTLYPPGFAVYVHNSLAQREQAVAHFVAAELKRGAVILLTPESDLSGWARMLADCLGAKPVLYHGRERAAQRKRTWRELRAGEHQLVIGVRAAVFAPVTDLAGIVVLDEHATVFKEERRPRYHARDVAIARAKLDDCAVLLSDPTPSTETWLNLRTGQYLPAPALPEAKGDRRKADGERPNLPDTVVVDMRKHKDEVLSPFLRNELRDIHATGAQAVLYINRRGVSRHVSCHDCGVPLLCPECAVSLVLLADARLVCRYCGLSSTAPDTCPACGSSNFRLKAPGVDLAAREVARLLPEAGVATVLSESARESPPESGSVVVGTRALFGTAWPKRVKLVAALSADADLCLPDFRAGERTFQALFRLSRIAASLGARLVVQTRRPNDPAVECAVAGDPARFLDQELKQREELGFPPYRRLALIQLKAANPAGAIQHAEQLCRTLSRARGVEALGPLLTPPRPVTAQVLVKLPRDLRLDRVLSPRQLDAPGVKSRVDIDPLEFV